MRTRSTLLALASGLLLACGGAQSADAPASAPSEPEAAAEVVEEEAAPAPTATLRFVHAASAPGVDIMAGDAMLLESVGAGNWNPERLTVPAGPHTINVAPTGTTDAVVSADVELAADGNYTVVVVGDASSVMRDTMPTAIVLDDTTDAPAAGQAKVRFVHGVAGGPAVNIATAEGRGFAAGVEYMGASAFYAVDAAQQEIVVSAGGDTLLSAPVGFAEGRLYTIIVSPSGEGVGAIVVNEGAL